MNKILVIGYGNTVRSDDGVGVWIAERIADLSLPFVEVQTCHQLQLEMVPDIIEYDAVILIDASATGEAIAYRRCSSSMALPSPSDHTVSPDTLQQLAFEVYHDSVELHLFTIRGESFEFGWTLSPAAEDRATEALARISSFLHSCKRKVPGSISTSIEAKA